MGVKCTSGIARRSRWLLAAVREAVARRRHLDRNGPCRPRPDPLGESQQVVGPVRDDVERRLVVAFDAGHRSTIGPRSSTYR